MESPDASAQDGSGLAAAPQQQQPPAARRAAGQRPAGRPPRYTGCQVCGASLEDAKSRFYKRYKICPLHSASAAVDVAGQLQRFCQQCGRFHPLDSFDGEMRSCRRQLARHAERRRAARAAAAAVRRAATASPSSSQVAGSGGAAAATMQAAAGPASPEPSNAVAATAGTAAVAAAAPQQQAEAATSGQPQAQAVSQAQAQASGSDSGSSSLSSPPTERCPSPTAGLDALLAAAEEEEAAERQAAAKRRAATKRPLEEAAMQEEQRAPKRLVCMGTAEGWCAPPLAATWPAAPAKPANPTLDAAALSCQTQQASLPASLLPPVAPLALPPLPALPVPLLPPPVAAAVASLGTSLQLLQQLPLQPQLAGLPTPPGWHEAYMAGLASMAAERIMLELLIAARQ